MYEVQWSGYKKYKKVNESHGVFNTFDEAYDSIVEWWKQNDFEPPYVRRWATGNVTTLDYGSHSSFYHIIENVE